MEGTLKLPFKEVNKNCIWRIKAALGYKIKIKIIEFKIRPVNSTCRSNYLVVYDGSTPHKKLSSRMCGYLNSNTEFLSTQPYVLIQYVSSSDVERQEHHLKLIYKSKV